MAPDQRPREFWIGIDSTGQVLPIAKDTQLTEEDLFQRGFMLNIFCHVIEKSAYDLECARSARLREALQIIYEKGNASAEWAENSSYEFALKVLAEDKDQK